MTEIRTLAPDEQLKEPGFYRIPLSRHHGQPCLSAESRAALAEGVLPPITEVSVTSGTLRTMELATPADVWAFHMLNPKRWERKETDALRLGRAMAAFVEGGMDEVARHFLILPEDKPRRPTAQQKSAYADGVATPTGRESVEFWAAVEKDPRDPVTDAETEMIANMGRALIEDPGAAAVMGGEPEVTMAWQDEVTGLWVLSRPDTVSFDGSVCDFKKINTQGKPFSHMVVDRRIEQHAYHQQMALAGEGLERLMGEWPAVVSIVAQWDQPPHHVILREIGPEPLEVGRWQNRRAITRFAECYASGYWPGPGDDVGAFKPSKGWWEFMQGQMTVTEEPKE